MAEYQFSKYFLALLEAHFNLAIIADALICLVIVAFRIKRQKNFRKFLNNENYLADFIKQWFMESYQQMYGMSTISDRDLEMIWAIAVGIFAVGGLLGAIFVGAMADKFGRRQALLYNNVLALFGVTLMTAAKYVGIFWLLIAGRFVIGLNAGLNSGLVPMYLTEISPMNLRGYIGSIAQLAVTIAILISQIVGLPFLLGSTERWPFIFAFAMIPIILQLCMLPFCAESPKFSLVFRGQRTKAESDLLRLRGQNNVKDELDQIMAEASTSAATEASFSPIQLFRKPLIWPLILAIFMHISQQFSGINAAIFYSTTIFKKAGLTGQLPNYATILMGTVNVLMTIVSTHLVERLGRRTLHIAGLSGLAISTCMVSISMIVSRSIEWFSLVTIIFVILMVLSVATGPGSIPWFYVNELFPMNARASANSVAVFTNWSSNALNIFHDYTFLIFTMFLCGFIIFALKYMPETKNKTLAEVEEAMGMKRRRALADDQQ